MKQKCLFLLSFASLFLLFSISVFAQVPQKMSYQAVIRNASDEAFSYYIVRIRCSILQGSSAGLSAYTETQLVNTDANGLIQIQIGTGTVVSGNFANINWANGPYFLKTEIDPNGGTNYTMTSTTQLLSTPYTYYAKNSASSFGNGTLDQAYDYTNFKGEGRTIIADSGAVTINGEDGLMITGTFGNGEFPEVTGSGTRMQFNPRTASFRAGHVDGTAWDAANTGLYSASLGVSTITSGEASFATGYSDATGLSSTALGRWNEASGDFSHAMGNHTKATGDNSMSFGSESKAVGTASIAGGSYSEARGNYSSAFGWGNANATASSVFGDNNTSNGLYGTVVGFLNDSLVGVQTSSASYNPLFMVGAGWYNYDYYGNAISATRRNSMKVYKSGKVIIGDVGGSYTTNPLLHTMSCAVGSHFKNTPNEAWLTDIQVMIEGKTGIGLADPASMLHVKGTGDASLTANGLFILDDIAGANLVMDNNEIIARNNGAVSNLSVQNGGGTVSIGIGSSTHILQINGTGRSTSSAWATSSDKRVKKNIQSLPESSLDKIVKLRPVTYQWIDAYKKANPALKEFNTGFISQEVEQVFPEMVEKVSEKFEDKVIDDFRILNLSDMQIHLTKAIQQQQVILQQLKRKISERQEQIDLLSAQMK